MLINLNILFSTIAFFLFCIILPKVTHNFKYFKNNLKKNHNVNTEEASVIGGSCLILSLLILNFINFNYFFIEYAVLIFFIGLLSDINIIQSPKKRLLLIVITIYFFSLIENFSILKTNVFYIDQLIINSNFLNAVFFVFCLSILINGCNFIDGINNNLNLYFLSSNVIILFMKLKFELNIDLNIFLILITLIFSFFNFFDKIFLGDSGAYLIGFILGTDLVYLFNYNNEISKFFAVLILFYPCFEVLFSIIRRFIIRYSPLIADTEHLHTILVNFFIKQKKEKKIAHLLSSGFLNIIFIIPVFFNLQEIHHTKKILISLLISASVYLILYKVLRKFR